jgi:hypothetical protein
MINHFSRCLLALALFAAFSTAMSWQVVSYALFATGIATVALANVREDKRWTQGAGVCVVIPGVGLLGGPDPALLLIVPLAALAVAITDKLGRRDVRGAQSRRESSRREDPLANLCISLPSAVALLAFLALA